MSQDKHVPGQKKIRMGNIFVPLAMVMLFFVLPLLPLGGWNAAKRIYYQITGLSWSDRASDYLSADVDRAVQLRLRVCDDGECIHKADWACGFTTDEWAFRNVAHEEFDSFLDAVGSCFSKLARVSPETKIDTLRKICGRHYMTFAPRQTRATPEGCEAAGGVWGAKPPVSTDAQLLLIQAGIH